MDHSCYKCGHSVEDGKPFCGQCGAPQIRVPMPEAVAIATEDASSLDLPILSVDSPILPGTLNASALSAGFVWPTAIARVRDRGIDCGIGHDAGTDGSSSGRVGSGSSRG